MEKRAPEQRQQQQHHSQASTEQTFVKHINTSWHPAGTGSDEQLM
jgi:hypothetical protein